MIAAAVNEAPGGRCAVLPVPDVRLGGFSFRPLENAEKQKTDVII